VRTARNDCWSFPSAVINGAFTVPGGGAIDFDAALMTLHDGGYEGWLSSKPSSIRWPRRAMRMRARAIKR
jgi:sugar phosphate isomerase/epimerase